MKQPVVIRTVNFAGCGIALVLCLVAAAFGYTLVSPTIAPLLSRAVGINDAAVGVSNEFMTTITARDYPKAYSQLSADWKVQIKSADDLKQAIITQGGELSAYTVDGFPMGNGPLGLAEGSVIVDGRTLYFQLFLVKTGDSWAINNYSTSTIPPTPRPE